MPDALADATREQRFTMALMAAFALLALVLTSVRIYGVISYSAHQRTREIGIVAALALTQFLATLLYGVAAIDPVSFVVVPLGLLAVAAGSVLIPAIRASRVESVEALRVE